MRWVSSASRTCKRSISTLPGVVDWPKSTSASRARSVPRGKPKVPQHSRQLMGRVHRVHLGGLVQTVVCQQIACCSQQSSPLHHRVPAPIPKGGDHALQLLLLALTVLIRGNAVFVGQWIILLSSLMRQKSA